MSGDAAPCEAASSLVAQGANERGSAAAAVPDERIERGPTRGNGAFPAAGSPRVARLSRGIALLGAGSAQLCTAPRHEQMSLVAR